MNDPIPTRAADRVTGSATASTLALQGVYLKDCSFEAPEGPVPMGSGARRSPSISTPTYVSSPVTCGRWY